MVIIAMLKQPIMNILLNQIATGMVCKAEKPVQNSATEIWDQLGNTIITAGSNSGGQNSLQLSDDGTIFAVKSISYVSVYQYSSGTQTWDLLGSDIPTAGNDITGISMSADGSTVCLDGSNGYYIYK